MLFHAASDASYNEGGTFRGRWFMNDGTPYTKIVGNTYVSGSIIVV